MPGFNVGRFFDDCNGVGLVGNRNFLGNGTETARRHRFRLSVSPLAGVTDFQLIIPIACEQIDRPTLRIQSETVWNGADFSHVPLRGEYEPIGAATEDAMTKELVFEHARQHELMIREWRKVYDQHKANPPSW
jgi:hypothetical protein